MSLSGAPDQLCAANFRQGTLLIRVLRRLNNLPRPATRHSVFLTHHVAVCAVNDGTVKLMTYQRASKRRRRVGRPNRVAPG